MASVFDAIFYILIFSSVYVQVFFLITFLENRKKIVIRSHKTKLTHYPRVTIAVPCWNEEGTVRKTVNSLLNLNYPADKIQILLIDDGSTDQTWNVLSEFTNYPNIKIFHKENGGKYTALNLGLLQMEADFFGCLDADSFVDRESLPRIMSYFETNPDVMAVVPSVVVYDFKNFIQSAQKAEYHMGVHLKKMLDFLGAINVTPGPLTIFRKKVFADLGPYRHGHNTEDMEIAYRMQKNRYKIEHCHDAFVYTNTPTTVIKLFRQRLRWIYGFINNTIDYRGVLFKGKYGNFSIFVLPAGVISIFAVSFLFGRIVYDLGNFLYAKISAFNTIGWHFALELPRFDLFFLNTRSPIFLVVLIYFLIIFSMVFGRKMAEGKWGFSFSMLFFFPIFTLVSPLWFLTAIFSTIIKRRPAWR